jgi:hypothetical protein
MGEATKGIVQVARKAADLYEHQKAIENKVKERCAACVLCHVDKIVRVIHVRNSS